MLNRDDLLALTKKVTDRVAALRGLLADERTTLSPVEAAKVAVELSKAEARLEKVTHEVRKNGETPALWRSAQMSD